MKKPYAYININEGRFIDRYLWIEFEVENGSDSSRVLRSEGSCDIAPTEGHTSTHVKNGKLNTIQ
jgi:hypothetical protein